ncbi:MAG: Putative transposase [Candidatus Midichloria mitochondrii]|uniref:Putative transposase n=1 Tax=Midichloria mitochondrii (strain IricVA) TaxID=696127 RepID=F7XUQ2_MIDMI|nr:hypothetical protein [Candidatus Midichloria mitochondrii]AEI88401.1 putative transposase [Candidatus Midichloria mitochondrii IricVA]MDJ1313606.1 transposase [Candidatus Midichloria mitochondrii]MDJ1584186.1 transposase [Candidatus Midichloria mitochondrii]
MKNKTRLAAFKQLLLAGRGLIETAIGQISWQTSFSGLLAYVFKPGISHGKIGSRAYSLRQTEVLIGII